MTSADYLVITFPEKTETQALEPRFQNLVRNGIRARRNGYVGLANPSIFFGHRYYDSTYMLQTSGAVAESLKDFIPDAIANNCSVARIDLQRTVEVDVNPDRIIYEIVPVYRYKALRYENIGQEGCTLYIGAPTSRVRLRIYNKSAESGKFGPNGKSLLRIEAQLRDKVADRAFSLWRKGAADTELDYQVSRMVSLKSSRRALDVIKRRDAIVPPQDLADDEVDAIERRKQWVERCALPAIYRIISADPRYLEYLTSALEAAIIRKGTE